MTRICRVKAFIDETENIDFHLEELAGIACLSKYHFLRLFRELFGETPMAYVRRKRLEKAKQALMAGTPVSDVARQAGYYDLPTFIRAYGRVFGISPSADNVI